MRLAVLASGEGSIFQSIVDHVKLGVLRGVEVTLLISNKRDSRALLRAERSGVKSLCVDNRLENNVKLPFSEVEEKIIKSLKDHDIDLVFLTGWNKILDRVVDEYPYRIMNTHPSLLPAFSGLFGIEVHRAVLSHGCKITGCTIHFVDKGVDTGPIIIQRAVEVREDEVVESLAERVKSVEKLVVPMAIQLYRDSRISLTRREGRVYAKVDYSGGWLETWNERQKTYTSHIE
ncbi:MAG: phosphoribosylglycinamide formyltransferase [Aigarchaeota archaeon]|nr:phosphoribosylglycinamide formyltransferase [Aigarchaeota archaeon]MDW8092725.1 phosphoribosylglycinamide formyltransferase [Nitrososphaerota archaeon]